MGFSTSLLNESIAFDSTLYTIVPANNNREEGVSFLNPATGKFVRHYEGKIIESEASMNSVAFPNDSTFITEDAGTGFRFYCSNPTMRDAYICKVDTDSFVVASEMSEHVFSIMGEDAEATALPSVEGLVGRTLRLGEQRYLIVPGNSDVPGHVSFLNPHSTKYLRHLDGELLETAGNVGPKVFARDSSFRPVAEQGKIVFHCVNKGMENLVIVQVEEGKCIVGGVDKAVALEIGAPCDASSFFVSMLKVQATLAARVEALGAQLAALDEGFRSLRKIADEMKAAMPTQVVIEEE